MNERIFISYKRADKEQVFALKKRIEDELGVKCWVDLDGVESSMQFASKICTAIDRSEVVLFMHSKAHLNIDYDKDWTVRELNYAHGEGKHVVLVRLDDAPLKNIFKMIYGTLNNIDSRNIDQWNILLHDLRKWLNIGTVSPTSASRPVQTLQYTKQELEEMFQKGQKAHNAKEYATAVEWYRKVAEQGFVSAQYNLGVMYANGQGVSQDFGEAVWWYSKAADHGYAEAQLKLGQMYFNGTGVSKDYGESVRWYRMAAEQGYAKAQYLLGGMYLIGFGVLQDISECVRWHRKAAEQGYADAQSSLGYLYTFGLGVSRDFGEAVRWYRKAAEQGCADAQYILARCYKAGQGVAQDKAEARRLFQKAADQGHEKAKKELQKL